MSINNFSDNREFWNKFCSEIYNNKFNVLSENLTKEQINSWEYQEPHIIFNQLKNAKSFKLDNSLAKLLWNTDSKIDYKHLPFSSIFLDTNIEVDEDLWIRSMLLFDFDGKEFKEDPNKFGLKNALSNNRKEIMIQLIIQNRTNFEVTTMFILLKDNQVNNDLSNLGNKIKDFYSSEQKQKQIRMFVCSFLHFLYNPDVEILEKIYTDKQIKRRETKCKTPYENHYYLKITGKTRQYLDSFDGEEFSRNYLRRTNCWIVRGFYRELKSDKYKFTREIWIAPYVKGMGKPKQKEYLVTDKKKVWMNQLQMESIIKEIYPEHLVITNTRGFLDGLEIDCYIPDLKLGFEYNGLQHYEQVEVFHKDECSLKNQKERDELKNKLAREKGIRLITIKYDEPLTKENILSKIEKEDN